MSMRIPTFCKIIDLKIFRVKIEKLSDQKECRICRRLLPTDRFSMDNRPKIPHLMHRCNGCLLSPEKRERRNFLARARYERNKEKNQVRGLDDCFV